MLDTNAAGLQCRQVVRCTRSGRCLTASGDALLLRQEFNSVEAIKSAVQHGLGVAFVSVMAIEKELQLGLLGCVPIAGVRLARPLLLVTNPARTLSGAAQKFMQARFPTSEACALRTSHGSQVSGHQHRMQALWRRPEVHAVIFLDDHPARCTRRERQSVSVHEHCPSRRTL